MDEEPLRRSRVLAVIGMVVAIGVAVGLVELHDPDGPISDVPLILLGVFVVVLASGVAVIQAIRVVVLSLEIRRAQVRWRTSDPSE